MILAKKLKAMLMPRDRAAELGIETVRILEAKEYVSAGGLTVKIDELLRRAVAATVSYRPGVALMSLHPSNYQTRIEVKNETTLEAARRLVDEGRRVVALNFASATHPGGGFLSGARAQEESLARSSGLYACLDGNGMYDFHRARIDAAYSDYSIYSPDVPVIRTDDGQLLDEPWPCSFITSAAVQAKALAKYDPGRLSEIEGLMHRRIVKVLAIAAAHHHETLVLGAWGCGAFGNDPNQIAGLFRSALHGPFSGVFAHVVFAITDWSEEKRSIGPFLDVFGPP
jgi:uncharacterized protein (TIGR02452 family)